MSKIIPHNRTSLVANQEREYLAAPVSIDYGYGDTPPIVAFSDGKQGVSSCLNCSDAPCLAFKPTEVRMPEELSSFPGDPEMSVCPTGAITWSHPNSSPIVEENSCIGCGLCAARCPYGAISMSDLGVPVVHTNDADRITRIRKSDRFRETHDLVSRIGVLGKIHNPLLENIDSNIAMLSDSAGLILARNLLIQAGVSCRVRRKGDTNMRVDSVGGVGDQVIAVIEIELTNNVLESPRALLEDIAILHNRYNIPIRKIVPISLILNLPNSRSEYYQVIDDINSVLGIHCRTITIGVLLYLVWHFKTVGIFSDGLFGTSVKGTDLHKEIKNKIAASVDPREVYKGAFYVHK